MLNTKSEPKANRIAKGIGLAVLAVIVGAVVVTLAPWQPRPNAPTTATQKSAAQAIDTNNEVKLFKVSDTVPFASETLQVNSVKSTQELSTQYSDPTIADNGTKFIVINMTLTNTTKTPFTYRSFHLIDQKDRQFEAYDKTLVVVDDYLTVKTMSPSVPLTGEEVYQVPQDSIDFRLGGNVGSSSQQQYVQFQVN